MSLMRDDSGEGRIMAVDYQSSIKGRVGDGVVVMMYSTSLSTMSLRSVRSSCRDVDPHIQMS
jgi:hypothetical protein